VIKIEAVSVCVGYGDFLAESAKINKGLFDHWTIITEPAIMSPARSAAGTISR